MKPSHGSRYIPGAMPGNAAASAIRRAARQAQGGMLTCVPAGVAPENARHHGAIAQRFAAAQFVDSPGGCRTGNNPPPSHGSQIVCVHRLAPSSALPISGKKPNRLIMRSDQTHYLPDSVVSVGRTMVSCATALAPGFRFHVVPAHARPVRRCSFDSTLVELECHQPLQLCAVRTGEQCRQQPDRRQVNVDSAISPAPAACSPTSVAPFDPQLRRWRRMGGSMPGPDSRLQATAATDTCRPGCWHRKQSQAVLIIKYAPGSDTPPIASLQAAGGTEEFTGLHAFGVDLFAGTAAEISSLTQLS